MSKKGDVQSILDMLVHIADENASDLRTRRESASRGLTAADIDKAEWAALHARASRRRKLLGDDLVEEDAEDEGDMLLAVIGALEQAEEPLTTYDLVGRLVQARLLSHQFPAAARAQATKLLERLCVANKVWQDAHGRWALVK
jgi:hypothetical protein